MPRKKSKSTDQFVCCHDLNGRTCIKVAEIDGMVKFIPMDLEGLQVHELSSFDFETRFKVLDDYPGS